MILTLDWDKMHTYICKTIVWLYIYFQSQFIVEKYNYIVSFIRQGIVWLYIYFQSKLGCCFGDCELSFISGFWCKSIQMWYFLNIFQTFFSSDSWWTYIKPCQHQGRRRSMRQTSSPSWLTEQQIRLPWRWSSSTFDSSSMLLSIEDVVHAHADGVLDAVFLTR